MQNFRPKAVPHANILKTDHAYAVSYENPLGEHARPKMTAEDRIAQGPRLGCVAIMGCGAGGPRIKTA